MIIEFKTFEEAVSYAKQLNDSAYLYHVNDEINNWHVVLTNIDATNYDNKPGCELKGKFFKAKFGVSWIDHHLK